MQGLIVCDHGLGYIGVDPTALQNSQAHVDVLGGYDAGKVVSFDPEAQETAVNLALKKQKRITQIDKRSAELVTAGMEAAPGKVVSTTLEAQQNLHDLAILVLLGQDPFPQGVSTIDGDQYTIVDTADFNRIVSLMLAHKLTPLDAGRQLRQDVIAAVDEDALDLVVDTRN
ncbi:MAG: DUF4376 domain-containing protein [Planctomycetota bacterium]|jgi:hypothetical protein